MLDIVFEFGQWFIPRICHAIGNLNRITLSAFEAELKALDNSMVSPFEKLSASSSLLVFAIGKTTIVFDTLIGLFELDPSFFIKKI